MKVRCITTRGVPAVLGAPWRELVRSWGAFGIPWGACLDGASGDLGGVRAAFGGSLENLRGAL